MPTIEELESIPLSTNPDDYSGLKPYAPGTIGAMSGDPLPGWSDESIPAAARVSSFMRQKINDRKNLPDFRDEFKSVFGSMPNKAVEDMFFVERGLQMPELSATEGSWRSQLVDELTHRAPFMGQVYSAKETNEYEAAEKRLEAGQATERDKGLIINYRLRQNRLKQKEESDKAYQAANFLGGLAAQGAEFLTGGGAVGQLAKKTGLTGGALFGARAAGTAAAVPTMGAYEKTYEMAAKGGRETPSVTDIMQGFTVGLINSAVAGTVEQFGAGKLGKIGMGTGAAGVGGRIGAGAVGGTIEDEIATSLLKNMSLETRYGPMLELLQGKGGDNWSRLAHSLIGEGIFAGVGAMRPEGHFDAERMQKVIDAGAKAIDAGLTPEEASGVLDAYHEALYRGEPAPKFRERDLDPLGKDRRRATRKQLDKEGRVLLDVVGDALQADMSPAKKALVEDLAKTLPEEADPFHGLSGQDIKDRAKAAGIDARQSIADLKKKITESPVGRALLQAEGRLEPDKPKEAQKPPEKPPEAQKPPEAEKPPEKPQEAPEAQKPPEAPEPQDGGDRPVAAVTDAQVEFWRRAILAGKMPAGVEVADWLVSKKLTPEQAKEIAFRLTGPDPQNLGVRERQVQKARERAKKTQAKPGPREAGTGLRQVKPAEAPAKRTYKLTPAQKQLRERIVIAGAVARMGRLAPMVDAPAMGPKSREQASREMLARRAMYQQNRLDRRVREKLKERQAAREALARGGTAADAQAAAAAQRAEFVARQRAAREQREAAAKKAEAARQEAIKQQRRANLKQIKIADSKSLVAAIRKLGGVSPESWESIGLDLETAKESLGESVFRDRNGRKATRHIDDVIDDLIRSGDVTVQPGEHPHDALRRKLERGDQSVEAIESAEGEQAAAKAMEDYYRDKEGGDLGKEGEYKPGEEDIPAAPPPSLFPVGTDADAVVVKNVGKAAEAHIEAVRDTLQHIPDEIHQAFSEAGGTIETGELISDIDPGLKGIQPTGWPYGTTWDNADGLYTTRTKTIYSTSHSYDMYESMYHGKNVKQKSKRVPGTLRHEYGHAVDYLMAVFGKPFSGASGAFRDAWKKDVANLTPEQFDDFAYFTTNPNALQEVFAEAFAAKFGGGADSRNVVKNYFPQASKVADAAIERFIHARISKQGAGGGVHPSGSKVGGWKHGGGLVQGYKSGGGLFGVVPRRVGGDGQRGERPGTERLARQPGGGRLVGPGGAGRAGPGLTAIGANQQPPPAPLPAPPPPTPQPRTTAEANAVADQERRVRKAPALAAAARLSNPQVWDAAMAEIDKNREVPELLINELTEKMRATTVQENAILLWKKITLQNDYYRAAKDLAALRANGGAPGDIANLEKLEYERYRAMDKLDQVLKRTGTEWGRSGQFRRQLAREDYTLGTMILSAQAAAGRELTAQERAEVTAQAEAIGRAEDAVEVEEGLVARGQGKSRGSQGDLRDLRITLDRLKTQFRQRQAQRRESRRPPSERVISTARSVSDAQRALRTAADLSSVLRQGGLYALGHPVRAYEAFRKALPFFTDQRAFDRAMAEIKDDPDFPLYERSGGFFADRDAGATAQEEAFMGNFWGRVAEGRGPSWMNNMAGRGLGRVVTASERFYTGHLNLIRFVGFKDMIQAYAGGEPTAEQARAAANFMNVLTGRGKLGQTFDKAAVPLAQVFFSPRNVVSRFQLIMAQPFYDASGMRLALAKEYGRVLGGAFILYGLVKMLMGDEAEVTFDPRSSDFGKIKVGETRIDPLAGLAQVSTLMGRMTTGQTKDAAGVVTSLRGDVPPGGETLVGTAAKFVRSKLAPIPSEGVNVVTGRDYFNEPTEAGKVIVGLGVPMSIENVVKGWTELGLGYGSLAGAINVLGVGVQNYGAGKDPTQRAVADVHAMRRKWEYDLGRPQEPRTGPPLVAEMEKAVGADDYGAFVEARTNFLNKQILAGRTRAQAIKSFKESSERLDPLEGRLNARDRVKFLASLTPQQKARVLEAQKMARERRAKLRSWWARASQSR